jgi:hypothetical protein
MCHYTIQNDTKQNDTKQNDTKQNDTKQNDTQLNDALRVTPNDTRRTTHNRMTVSIMIISNTVIKRF